MSWSPFGYRSCTAPSSRDQLPTDSWGPLSPGHCSHSKSEGPVKMTHPLKGTFIRWSHHSLFPGFATLPLSLPSIFRKPASTVGGRGSRKQMATPFSALSEVYSSCF